MNEEEELLPYSADEGLQLQPFSREPSPGHDFIELREASPSILVNITNNYSCLEDGALLFTPRSGKNLLIESDEFLNTHLLQSMNLNDTENIPPTVENIAHDMQRNSGMNEHDITDETFAESVENFIDDLSAENSAVQLVSEQNNENTPPPVKKNPRKRVRDPKIRLECNKMKHPLLPPCPSSCTKRCSSFLDEDQRIAIWENFWSLDTQRRRDFISRNVERKPVAVKYTRSNKRSCTLIWNLKDMVVCKNMFLHIIGYKHDQVVQAVLKANYKYYGRIQDVAGSVSAAPDLRGKHTPPHAFSTDQIKQIEETIESFRPMPSHYNSEHAPNRLYLPTGCTFKIVFDQVNTKLLENSYKKCAWSSFMKIIKKKNISTMMPKQDLCTKCVDHVMAHSTDSSELSPTVSHDCNACECDACDGFLQHKYNKTISRELLVLQQDSETAKVSEGKIAIYTSDLQKVISMPKLATKDFFFSRKLNLYNETFSAPGKNGDSVVILWHEGEGGRKANNIATTYVHFVKKYCRDIEKLILYMYNCNAQNKNKILYSAMMRVIHDNEVNLKSIKIVYLEPGHTYMSADSVHSSISRKLNDAGELYDFKDYVDVIKSSRRRLEIQELQHQDFMLFEDEMKAKFPKNLNISKYKVVEFRRGITNLFVKVQYNEDFHEIDVFKLKFKREMQNYINTGCSVSSFVKIQYQQVPNGVSKLKKNDLIKLSKSMPMPRRIFFENLRVNEEIEEEDSPIF